MSTLLTYFVPPLGAVVGVFVLAEATGQDFSVLSNYGVAGVVLLWFMFMIYPQLKRMEESRHQDSLNTQEAMDRFARSNVMLTLALKISALEDAAKAMDVELDKAEVARKATQK